MYTFYCLLPRSGKIFTIFMLKSALECTKMNVFMHFSEKQSKKFRLYRTNESKIFVCTRAKSFVLYKKNKVHCSTSTQMLLKHRYAGKFLSFEISTFVRVFCYCC